MSSLRVLSLSCLLALVPSLSLSQSDTAPTSSGKPQPAYLSDPRFIDTMKEAKDLEHRHQFIFALDDYKKANKIAGGACHDCMEKMFQLQLGGQQYKDAIATAEQMKAVAADPASRSIAESHLGSALLAQGGDKPKQPQLDAAHAAFQAAINDYPRNLYAEYFDACTLARMGKNDDASREFAHCADAAPASNPMKVRARHFAENPALSMNKMAPAFEVTALDGTRFNLDNMEGHVVLVDFWATWCGPCNRELPHLKKIAKEFANQPFVIISISSDKDEAKWKDFVAKNEMTWVQYRDKDSSIGRSFGVEYIPSYFVIGSDGVMQNQRMGADDDVEGKIKKLLKQAREDQSHGTEKAENKAL